MAGIGGNVAGSATSALVGGGISLLGQALAPRAKPQAGTPAGPVPAASSPNMGAPASPLPGARWSPLLMRTNVAPGSAASSAAGLETQRRMRRGGATGGMTMY